MLKTAHDCTNAHMTAHDCSRLLTTAHDWRSWNMHNEAHATVQANVKQIFRAASTPKVCTLVSLEDGMHRITASAGRDVARKTCVSQLTHNMCQWQEHASHMRTHMARVPTRLWMLGTIQSQWQRTTNANSWMIAKKHDHHHDFPNEKAILTK